MVMVCGTRSGLLNPLMNCKASRLSSDSVVSENATEKKLNWPEPLKCLFTSPANTDESTPELRNNPNGISAINWRLKLSTNIDSSFPGSCLGSAACEYRSQYSMGCTGSLFSKPAQVPEI